MGLILVLVLVLMIGFIYSLTKETDKDKIADEQLKEIEKMKEKETISIKVITDGRYYVKGNHITQTLSNTTWLKNPFVGIQEELNNYYDLLRVSGIDFEIVNITTEVIKKEGLFDTDLQKAFATITIKIL